MNELLLLAVVAGERVAFRAADIQSVIEVDEITPVPRAPDFIAGLAALRSRPMTVIDCALSLGIERPGHQPGTIRKAVVVEEERHIYALLVDAIEDVVETDGSVTMPPGKLLPGWERASAGIVETPVGPLLLAEPARLIAGPDRACAA